VPFSLGDAPPLTKTPFHAFERLIITDAVLLTEQVPHVVDVVRLILDKASAEPPQCMVPELGGHQAFRRGLYDHEVVAAEDLHELNIESFSGLGPFKVFDGLDSLVCEPTAVFT
jgi:hypothetical protein